MRFKNIWHILLVLLMISPNVHAEGNPASITAACNTLTRLQSGQDGQSASGQKQLYMSLRTNMLYDALAVPNISAEIYLGRNWSVSAGWMHAWWSYDRRHRYWRIYGGEINGRYWFGPEAHNKPLTGHHVGLYLQALTYDFEFGGKAYMGGEPGGTILDRAHIGGGIEYGNLRSARGAISGLASGRRSSSGSGVITADIRCFGLPANHAGTPPENRLELQALLADGKTVKKYDMAVGHLIDQSATSGRNRGDNLDLHLEIWLEPALPPCSGNSGIDV